MQSAANEKKQYDHLPSLDKIPNHRSERSLNLPEIKANILSNNKEITLSYIQERKERLKARLEALYSGQKSLPPKSKSILTPLKKRGPDYYQRNEDAAHVSLEHAPSGY